MKEGQRRVAAGRFGERCTPLATWSFGQDYLLYFWWQEVFAILADSPCSLVLATASSSLSVLFDSVFWLGSA